MAHPAIFNVGICAGVGMLDEGARLAFGDEFRTVVYVEREAFAASTLMARMADTALEPAPIWCGNLEQVEWSGLRGRVDSFTAGFPCQPWSAAGKQQGVKDERWIWPAIASAIRDAQPWLVLLENVSGLISGGGLAEVLGSLAELGFDAEWGVLSAAAVGASHQRKRVFIVAVYREHGRRKLREWFDGVGQAHPASRQQGWLQQRGQGCESSSNQSSMADSGERQFQEAGRTTDSRSGIGYSGAGIRGVGQANSPQQREREPNDTQCANTRGDARENIGGRSGQLGSPNCPDAQRRRGSDGASGRQESHGHAGLAVGEMADTERGGFGERANKAEHKSLRWSGSRKPQGCICNGDAEIFAPGPSDPRWQDILRDNPHLAPAIESGVCGMVDGMAVVVDESRADQLRAIGNGVVPLQAAIAFRVLVERLLAS